MSSMSQTLELVLLLIYNVPPLFKRAFSTEVSFNTSSKVEDTFGRLLLSFFHYKVSKCGISKVE